MKKILVTQRLANNESYYECREMLDVFWGKLFSTIGFLPIVLPFECDFTNFFKELQIDGILLTGGNDLNSLNPNGLSQKRDCLERTLITYALGNDIPIFGVCRGLQIIAEYFGSTFKRVDGQVNIRHILDGNKDSQYFKFIKNIKEVNSFHNYSVDNLSSELIVSAVSSDGIIKAIEHKEYKVFAQMWHSERDEPFDQKQLELIKEFFN